MSSAADGGEKPSGLEALHLLKSTEPPLYLTPSPELSKAARLASEYLFTSINPYAPKSPFNHLLTEGFDAEQIWQQIDLQAQPLLSSLRRQVRNFEKNPSEIEKQFNVDRDSGKEVNLIEDGKTKRNDGVESESEDFDDDGDMDEEDGDEEDEGEDEEGEEGEESGEDDENMENVEGENVNGVEDKFLKIKELEEYLVEDEAREYGTKKDKKKKNKRKRGEISDEDEEDEEGDEEDEEDEDDELGLMGLGDDDGSDIETARYEDFFTSKKSSSQKKNPKYDDDGESDDMDTDEPDNDDDNQNEQSLPSNGKELGKLRAKTEEMEKANMQSKMKGLSTHEKELEKLRAEIEEMERANMEPKTWTMQGEVTAAKRPKNSALEVDLDFEHNVRPVPQTTEEGTASLEELIKKRIVEGQFDDVQKPPNLLTKAPREKKELDENKSKKGLAELYEEDYAQKTGLVSAALSFSDEQKKEASLLFKKICVKLDALSHFHFAPKPVIEDMSIQANVPALAMEEVAPLVVSDAAMLAPEEVFSGKGDIKEEKELTKTERKRRRAKKKRQFKAESVKRMAVKAQLNTLKKAEEVAGNGESHE